MTWSYSGDPSSSLKDQVRFLTGLTIPPPATPNVDDEEILWALSISNDNPYMAAAIVCETVATKLATYESASVDRLTKSRGSGAADRWLKLADQFRIRAGISGIKPYFGGINKSLTEEQRNDTSVIQPEFDVGEFDNHGPVYG